MKHCSLQFGIALRNSLANKIPVANKCCGDSSGKLRRNTLNIVRILILSLLLFALGAQGNERDIRKDYPLTKLTDNVYVIHGPNEEVSRENQGFRNNPVIVTTSQGVVVVDPGSSLYTGELVNRKVKGITDKPIIAVFNTHDHGDHWLGNHGIRKHYPDVPIYSHPKMKQAIESGGGDMWIKAINQRTEGAIEGTKVVAPDHMVKQGDEIKFGNITFRIYESGKAHSDSDIMLEIVEEQVFLFGDVLRDKNISPFMASFKGNLAALELGEKLKAKVYVPGHGKSGDKSVIEHYRNFIIALKAEVKKYFEAGLSDFEMKPKVIKSLAQYQDWTGVDENIGRLISLAYLEVENESF
ncbi:MBL fold metallo-hydrolase [Kaarinaea lacus]